MAGDHQLIVGIHRQIRRQQRRDDRPRLCYPRIIDPIKAVACCTYSGARTEVQTGEDEGTGELSAAEGQDEALVRCIEGEVAG